MPEIVPSRGEAEPLESNHENSNDVFRDFDLDLLDAPEDTITRITDGLGIDEEIKPVKKRTPIAKLDVHR